MIKVSNMKNKKVIGWGSGNLFKECFEKQKIELSYIIDNDPEKWKDNIYNIIIKSAESLKNENIENTVIVIFSSFYRDIVASILQYGDFQFYIYNELDCYCKIGTNNEDTRFRWVVEKLNEIPNDARILDAGAGEQQYKSFCNHLKYVSQDFNEYDGKGNGNGLQTLEWNYDGLDIVSDITNIPESDKSFDAILCTEVFEHLSNPIEAIKEFSRLTKKGGKLILTAPFCSLTHFSPYHYYTGFNRYFYKYHLEENNFKIIEMDTNGTYFEYIAQELRRIPEVCKNYSKYNLKESDKRKINEILQVLNYIELESSNSDELLCHGYHILAEKVED